MRVVVFCCPLDKGHVGEAEVRNFLYRTNKRLKTKKIERTTDTINSRIQNISMDVHKTNYNPLEIQLAHEIAAKLEDPDALSLYLQFTHALPHDKLRELLEKVVNMPDRLIKRSRGALYTHLVNQYKQYDHDYSGN